MNHRWRLAGAIYLAWALGWLAAAAVQGGEVAEAAHLCLILTGLPSALLSLALPHASLPAIALAGALGTVQWAAVVALAGYMDRRRPRPG